MGRAPCCEKTGLKRGPWAAEEDLILINYINRNGHPNWRALPKRAGLLRCGKSCRLRWMNYLRPDIKRGDFTTEEEENIIKLHQELGNRWSLIAARLPGRTDNEIKNVWHTHLKKRLNKKPEPEPEPEIHTTESSDFTQTEITYSLGNLPEVDESFWSEVLSGDDGSATSDFSSVNSDSMIQFSNPFGSDVNLVTEGDMDFWCNYPNFDYLFQ